jgi:hypothetical protein
MEIVIGAVPRVGQPLKKTETRGGFVEARVLNIRPPRRRLNGIGTGEVDRRDRNTAQDPASGRVMVLLVPEGQNIPKDITSGNYRIFLRFARKQR